MQIEENQPDASPAYEDLSQGDVFRCDGEVFMRTDEASALNLETGYLAYFDSDTKVTLIHSSRVRLVIS